MKAVNIKLSKRIKKLGGSYAIVLTKEDRKLFHLKFDDIVSIWVEKRDEDNG